jgi:hypothetical protein
MPNKRVPVSGQFGRGADAFFGPATQEEEEQDTGKPVQQETGKPGIQQNSMPVEQLKAEGHVAGRQVNQQDSISVGSSTSRLASQDTSEPVNQEAGKLMKATYYITPEQDLKLERVRLARRQQGMRIDKSALIRQAIDRLPE